MNNLSRPIPFDHIRAISDPQRLAILRRLMSGPATLSQLGEYFQASAAHIRHHLKVLEQSGLVELVGTRQVRGFLEKYYRASSYAFMVHFTIIPEERRSVVIASMDYAVARLAGHLAETQPGLIPLVFPMSSLDGLVSLRQGICQMATCHLLDPDTGEYNLPTIHSLFPGQAMVVVRLYNRVEGLLVGAGNPEGIRRIEDLAAGEFRIAKREPGSGVQVWFDHALRQAGANPDHTSATSVLVRSHAEAAQAVIRGAVDAAVGIQALPQPAGIDFIPLFEEPYDLVLHEEDYQDPRLSTFFEYLFSPDFGNDVLSSGTAGGYRLDSTGLRVTHVS